MRLAGFKECKNMCKKESYKRMCVREKKYVCVCVCVGGVFVLPLHPSPSSPEPHIGHNKPLYTVTL